MAPTRRISDEALLAYVQQGYELADIVRLTGIPKPTIVVARKRLARKGLLTLRPHRLWTNEDSEALIDYLQAGTPLIHISRQLQRSIKAIVMKAHKDGISLKQCMSAQDVARLFAKAPYAQEYIPFIVRGWIERGLLKAKRNPFASQGHYRISDSDLQTFLADPATWNLWRPEWIADPDWRYWAEELRNPQGADRYLTWLKVKREAS